MRLDDLTPEGRDLAQSSLAWMDPWWDPDAHLLWNPPGAFEDLFREPKQAHMIRESAWYALGLLLRGDTGDEARAATTIAAILGHQYDQAGAPWHGTWPRFPEEPRPSGDARMWIDFDPNWRQFVGSALALSTRLFRDALDDRLLADVDVALRRAVAGEPPDRVPPNYSNVALMRAWLEGETARRSGDEKLADRAVAYGESVADLFEVFGSFEEYNSPTYYGIDLYALALWRSHSDLPELAKRGARIERALWEDFARFYHADLKNACGPYSRAYGMDMSAYVANISMWLWAGIGRSNTPFPPTEGELRHGHDFAKGPAISILGARIPEAAASHLTVFSGERTVEQRISADPDRVATAWLGDGVMVGAETNGAGWNAYGQYHPATVHWTDGRLGWIRIVRRGPLHARASEGTLAFDVAPHRRHGPQPTTVLIAHPGVSDVAVKRGRWQLPGLDVAVRTGADLVASTTEPGLLELTYAGADSVQRFELGFR